MKKYWIPEGDWPIGTGYEHAHRLLQNWGLAPGTQEDYDLLVLPGGADIGKRPQRDEVELRALEHANGNGKKIFGICRGMQLMLYSEGMPIIDHIPDVSVLIEHRTLTGDWTGQSGWHKTALGLLVNSRHHQGFSGWPADWEILDYTEDGIVETIYRKNRYGVQWHPEHPEMINTYALEWLKQDLKKRDMI
jgi:putative glutamine amidotransferase